MVAAECRVESRFVRRRVNGDGGFGDEAEGDGFDAVGSNWDRGWVHLGPFGGWWFRKAACGSCAGEESGEAGAEGFVVVRGGVVGGREDVLRHVVLPVWLGGERVSCCGSGWSSRGWEVGAGYRRTPVPRLPA